MFVSRFDVEIAADQSLKTSCRFDLEPNTRGANVKLTVDNLGVVLEPKIKRITRQNSIHDPPTRYVVVAAVGVNGEALIRQDFAGRVLRDGIRTRIEGDFHVIVIECVVDV